jgi:hypothetical protein
MRAHGVRILGVPACCVFGELVDPPMQQRIGDTALRIAVHREIDRRAKGGGLQEIAHRIAARIEPPDVAPVGRPSSQSSAGGAQQNRHFERHFNP